MREIFESIKDWWKERATSPSPIWGVYFFAFIFWNWKIIYTLFWQDTSIFRQPVIEYVEQNILFFHGADGWSKLFALLGNDFFAVAFPALITFLIIKYLRFAHAWAARIKERSNFELLEIRDKEERIYQSKKESFLKDLAESKGRQTVAVQDIQKSEKQIRANLTEEEKWEIEFLENEQTLSDNDFSAILDAIYEKKGRVTDPIGGHLILSRIILAFVDSLGLITFNDTRNHIALSEKGKYFAKNFLKKRGGLF